MTYILKLNITFKQSAPQFQQKSPKAATLENAVFQRVIHETWLGITYNQGSTINLSMRYNRIMHLMPKALSSGRWCAFKKHVYTTLAYVYPW